MGSRENFIIFISNIGGNYAVALQNGETGEFFLQSPNNFLAKFLTLRGIKCNYRFFSGAGILPLRGSVPPPIFTVVIPPAESSAPAPPTGEAGALLVSACLPPGGR